MNMHCTDIVCRAQRHQLLEFKLPQRLNEIVYRGYALYSALYSVDTVDTQPSLASSAAFE